jgi:hypothetical protein
MVFLGSAVNFLPNLAAAIILLLIGWLVGLVVGKIVKEVLVRFKVDHYVSKGKPMFKISELLPLIFEWLIYLVFIQAAVGTLGVVALAEFVRMIVGFIPGLIGAVIVVIVGYAIAEYVKSKVEESKMAYAGMMSKVLFWLLVYVAVALALPLVGINAALINNILLIGVGSVGIGIAIALGLGLKDVVADMAKKYVKGRK